MVVNVHETKLYMWLKNRNSGFLSQVDKMIFLAERMLPLIKNVFANYTDHGIMHSIHVMEYMYALIEDINELSELEVVLLIESALLHDIGMVANETEINDIKNGKNVWTERKYSKVYEEYLNEDIALQECIRPFHGKRSKRYIDENIDITDTMLPDSTSITFREELGLICMAHNEDFEWLENNIGEKYEKGSYVLNGQYIAVLLRIADYLDIDDQRAPQCVYNYLNPGEYSAGEWKKHFAIENYEKVKRNEQTGLKEIVFRGQSSDPEVYRKLLKYFDNVNDELYQAVQWSKRVIEKKYYIRINPLINNEVCTKGFTMSNLKLSVDFTSIMKLLMGENIYGNRKYGLRELIQNSIDACSVMQERALQLEEYRYENYQPEIHIIADYDKQQLIIKDNGTGMDDMVLNKYFLTIGKSYYRSEDFKYQNLQYRPIGKFGIGFLACFMLSSKIMIETRSYKENKGVILEFNKDSEYICQRQSKNLRTSFGTIIYLNLREVIKIFWDADAIVEFIKETFLSSNIDIYFEEIKMKGDVRKQTIEKIELPDLKKMMEGKQELTKYLKNIDCAVEVCGRMHPIKSLSEIDMYHVTQNIKTYSYDENQRRIFLTTNLKYKELRKYQSDNYINFLVVTGVPSRNRNEYEQWKKIYKRKKDKITQLIFKNLLQEDIIIMPKENDIVKKLEIMPTYLESYIEYGIDYGVNCMNLDKVLEINHTGKLKIDLENIIKQCDFINETIKLSKRTIEVQAVGEERFFQINQIGEEDFKLKRIINRRVYWRGVRLSNENITFHMNIPYIALGDCVININDKEIVPDISRNTISAEGRIKLREIISNAICNYLIDNETDDEIKAAIREYMENVKRKIQYSWI